MGLETGSMSGLSCGLYGSVDFGEDYRDEQGNNRNRLRPWEKEDIVPRPEDILQERNEERGGVSCVLPNFQGLPAGCSA